VFAWVVFTSAAGVRALLDRLRARGGDGPAIRGRVAAVGEGTARALREAGVEPDLVPSTFTTAALARGLPRGSGRVLLARADIAPPDLDRAVGAKGWTVVRVDAYRTRPVRRLPARVAGALREGRVDAVTFTSASTVEGFARLAGEALRASPRRPAVVCIGPVTAGAARARGLSVDAVARPHTIDGLVAALERVLGPSGGGKESP
jgi:uroporphyrinogen III methyltransferase/synthase